MKKYYKPKGRPMVLLEEHEIEMMIKGEEPSKPKNKKSKKKDEGNE